MELIPLTDFDQRNFPEISEEEKVSFIVETNKLEKIDTNEDKVRSSLMIQEQADPYVSGQMRAIGLIEELAKNQNLIPKVKDLKTENFDTLVPWFVRLHKNLLFDLSQKGATLLNDQDYPSERELGIYRQEDKLLGHRHMPAPYSIKKLLVEAMKEYAETYYRYHDKLSTPRLLEHEDWKKLEEAAYKFNLRICCIKPFQDGSNRVARLSENLLRLNVGLKFKIILDKDKLLRDIWNLQDSEYKIT